MRYFQYLVFILGIVGLFLGCNAPTSSDSIVPNQDDGASSVDTGATATPTPNPDLTGSAALDAEELAFLAKINEYRAESGLPKLGISVSLTKAADWLSVDMAERNYFSHTDSQGRSFFSRIQDFGSSSGTASENIAAGNSGAAATFTQWKNSSGHNANMLGSSYRSIGIGRAYDSGRSYGWYWTTDFGSSAD